MTGIIVETYFCATLEETYESTLAELNWALRIPYNWTITDVSDNCTNGIPPIKNKHGFSK